MRVFEDMFRSLRRANETAPLNWLRHVWKKIGFEVLLEQKAADLFAICDQEDKAFVTKRDMQRLRNEVYCSCAYSVGILNGIFHFIKEFFNQIIGSNQVQFLTLLNFWKILDDFLILSKMISFKFCQSITLLLGWANSPFACQSAQCDKLTAPFRKISDQFLIKG